MHVLIFHRYSAETGEGWKQIRNGINIIKAERPTTNNNVYRDSASKYYWCLSHRPNYMHSDLIHALFTELLFVFSIIPGLSPHISIAVCSAQFSVSPSYI